mgnify:CR=1 FL=1
MRALSEKNTPGFHRAGLMSPNTSDELTSSE